MFFAARRAARSPAAWALPVLVFMTPVSLFADTGAPDSIAALASVVDDSIPLAGHVVYLDFWASWCIPCRSSFPWMASMRARYHEQGLQVVTINLDKDPAAARKFLAEMKSPLPVIYDSKGTLATKFKLEVMPTSFVFGRDGKLRSRHEGFHADDSDSVESTIVDLLKEKAPQ
jgi:thiol-disulfide isomerase/thioredoxin